MTEDLRSPILAGKGSIPITNATSHSTSCSRYRSRPRRCFILTS